MEHMQFTEHSLQFANALSRPALEAILDVYLALSAITQLLLLGALDFEVLTTWWAMLELDLISRVVSGAAALDIIE